MSGFNRLLVSIYHELVLTHCSANSFSIPSVFTVVVMMSAYEHEYESGGEEKDCLPARPAQCR